MSTKSSMIGSRSCLAAYRVVFRLGFYTAGASDLDDRSNDQYFHTRNSCYMNSFSNMSYNKWGSN